MVPCRAASVSPGRARGVWSCLRAAAALLRRSPACVLVRGCFLAGNWAKTCACRHAGTAHAATAHKQTHTRLAQLCLCSAPLLSCAVAQLCLCYVPPLCVGHLSSPHFFYNTRGEYTHTQPVCGRVSVVRVFVSCGAGNAIEANTAPARQEVLKTVAPVLRPPPPQPWTQTTTHTAHSTHSDHVSDT